jgi:hypothetical protein
MPRRHPWLHRLAWLRRNRCSLLLAWLGVLILANPIFSISRIGAKLLAVGLVAVLMLAAWALRMRGARLLTALAAALLTAAAIVLSPGEHHWLRPVSVAAVALLNGVVTVALLRYVLDWHLITVDKVFGAVAAYVLIALTFACLFNLLGLVQPNAFYIAQVNNPDGHMSWSDAMYFSFTVLTSTGFGEITPVTDMARSLIVIEQVLGVMYVAFLVARLANLYGLERRR